MTAKYAFIAGEEGHYPIHKMCRWAKVSRSGFYEWRGRVPSATAARREILSSLVRFAFEHSDGTSGYRRIHAQLRRWGHHYDDETVRSVMRDLGLVACQPRPFRPVTTVPGDASQLPDLVQRDFTATAPGCKLVGDVTYIATWQGWLYLATVLDCFSKKVVGYAMADHMRTSLVSEALRMAAGRVTFIPGETIFHSDRGAQGGINRSSQHLDDGGVVWQVGGGSGRRIGRCGRRCGRRDGRSRRGRCSVCSGG